ncbi:hypothetical protein EV127DRAFT_240603 [Xylaria flabelliformis]|nr:hypothetical protein EV127DRAFT_240603 [Xylaria flabelliformis]
MRSHTFITAFAAAGAVAELNMESSRQGRQAAVNVIKSQDQASLALVAHSQTRLHTLFTRMIAVKTDDSDPPTILSIRKDHDHDDDDGDDDGDDDDDDEDEDDDEKHRRRPNTAAIAGGVVGGVVLLLLLLFLLFWFKFRPRRQNRRRKQRERDEEEQRKIKEGDEQENSHAMTTYKPYQPVPSDDEPPRYQHVVATGVPRAAASTPPPPSPPRGTADFPAELPSPVDGREPSPLPPPSQLDFSKETRDSYQQTQITIQPEERSGHVY